MKKDMTEYFNSLTLGNMDALDVLISFQYRKFVRFYKLIRDYSDLITKVRYEFKSNDSLDIMMTFDSKRSLKSIKDELESSMAKSKYEGKIRIQKKNVYMSLFLDEG